MSGEPTETIDLLRAVVALLADQREARIATDPTAEKTEVILKSSGLTRQVIAEVLGKKPDAVRKTISRARQRS